MIGNDIVDLNIANINSRWQEQRFLDKLFNKKELSIIFKDDFRYLNIWRLWSMKESAYKIQSRNLKGWVFNPKLFHCEITSDTFGTVSFDNNTINTTTENDSNAIYTTAHLHESSHISEYFELKDLSQIDKSKELKEKAIQAFSVLKSISEINITIEKNVFGIPQFFIYGKAQDDLLTLTHHGNYGGFAILNSLFLD